MGPISIIYYEALNTFSVLLPANIPEVNLTGSLASPYRFILYGALIIAFVILLVRSQTVMLIKTRKLLKEKEQALDLIASQKIELETRDKNLTDSLKYAQRIQEALLPSEAYFRNHFTAKQSA